MYEYQIPGIEGLGHRGSNFPNWRANSRGSHSRTTTSKHYKHFVSEEIMRASKVGDMPQGYFLHSPWYGRTP